MMTSKDQAPFELSREVPPVTRAVSSDHDSKDLPARVLKKRESDRRCQRIKRERTKSKIAALEERVRSFGDQDPTGHVQTLMQQLQNVERDRDELAKKVQTIEHIIREGGVENVSRKRDNDTMREGLVPREKSLNAPESPDHEYLNSSTHHIRVGKKPAAFETPLTNEVDIPALVYNVPASHNERLPGVDAPTTDTSQNPNMSGMTNFPHPSDPTCECCVGRTTPADPSQFSTWRFTNQLLSSRFQWPAYYQMLQDTFGDDIPIRAVVEGWEAVEARGFMHPSWLILKKFDQSLFRNWQPKERLAVMYATQLLLMSHTSSEVIPELPTFYRKRPSQSMANNYAVHFFPWPGMRERFVYNQHRYCTNIFWKTFLSCLRIRWPYEFRDCYTKNIETGIYSISSTFEERVNDINCWAMESEVFLRWPELAVDIPQYNTIPPTVSNVVQNPRRLKAPPRRRPTSIQQNESNLCRSTDSIFHATQSYYPVDPFDSQPLAYSVSDKTMPDMGWAEYRVPQASTGVKHFASPVAPSNNNTNR